MTPGVWRAGVGQEVKQVRSRVLGTDATIPTPLPLPQPHAHKKEPT